MNKKVAELAAKNMEAEAEAIKEYLPLLDALLEAGDTVGANIVKEIIGDEKNHQNLLQVILMHHDGGIPIASDDMLPTFKYLGQHLKNE